MALYQGEARLAGRGQDGGITSTRIAAGTNLNDIQTAGLYYSPMNADVATFTNCPTGMALSLLVEKHAGTKQTLTEYLTSNPNTWTRNYYNGTWGLWVRQNITIGTAAPTGGSDGDIYFRYVV